MILPGYGNSSPDHWQSYFEKNLLNCFRLAPGSWELPDCRDWVEAIENQTQKIDGKKLFVITHSLGGIAFLHWSKQFRRKIQGAMIVAPPDIETPYIDLGLQSFAPIPRQRLTFPSFVVASDNDNWMHCERTKYFTECWGSELIMIRNAGHINPASGFSEWDEGLTMLRRFQSAIVS
jgi:uncharacterized protein